MEIRQIDNYKGGQSVFEEMLFSNQKKDDPIFRGRLKYLDVYSSQSYFNCFNHKEQMK